MNSDSLLVAGTDTLPDASELGLSAGWRTVNLLGRGGASRVVHVVNDFSGDHAAVKQILPELRTEQQIVAMFGNEADMLYRLFRAPHVLRLHPAHNPLEHHTTLVLNYCGRGSADTFGAIAPHEVIEIGMQTLDALDAAHNLGLLHCDIKPQNILLDDEGQVQVCDWGLARKMTAEDDTEFECASVPGTVLYMPPELADRRGDERSDIYSLGCTLFEIATGRPAFDLEGGATPLNVMLQHMHENGPNPRILNRKIPRCLASVIEAAMKVRAGERFQTARQMKRALEWCKRGFWGKAQYGFLRRLWMRGA